MNRTFAIAALGSLLVLPVLAGGVFNAAHAQTAAADIASNSTSTGASDLKAQIDAKNKQLQGINQQLQETQATLKATQTQKNTLQNQVNTLNANIKSLNLGIQSDQITSQQLQLQIQQLNDGLGDITASIADKQAGIESLLRQLERNDAGNNNNLLVVFLKKGTLADGVLEAQTLHNLQAQLAGDIENLKDLHDQYDNTIQESAAKKDQIATHQQSLQAKVSIVQDEQAEKQNLLVTTKGQESIYQKQVADLQKQQQQIASDIESLDAILRTQVDPSALPAREAGVLLVPIASDGAGDITQGYGSTDFAKNGYAGHWHNGLDLAASIGTPVRAAADGVVSGVANEDLYCPRGAYGKFITIDHANGLTTLYGHLSRQLVKKGQTVKRGQVIGYSGKTGYATGPHLHFTVFAQSTFRVSNSKSCGPLPVGGDLDPYPYLF